MYLFSYWDPDCWHWGWWNIILTGRQSSNGFFLANRSIRWLYCGLYHENYISCWLLLELNSEHGHFISMLQFPLIIKEQHVVERLGKWSPSLFSFLPSNCFMLGTLSVLLGLDVAPESFLSTMIAFTQLRGTQFRTFSVLCYLMSRGIHTYGILNVARDKLLEPSLGLIWLNSKVFWHLALTCHKC